MNDLERFSSLVSETLENLFNAAKSKEELSYIFALLGLDSGMEDAGWKPISETWELLRDITSLANSPLKDDTKVRLLLLLYSQITEASFLYHVIYNMILSIDNKSARIFNFTELYRGATPPSAKSKVSQICKKAVEIHHDNLKIILEEVFDSRIRNAISHSDYILYKDEMRLKHKGGEILSIKVNDVIFKINKAIIFFQNFFYTINSHKKSYKDGYVVKRKTKSGQNLADITLKVDKNIGLYGLSTSGPSPLWDPSIL